MGEKPLVRLASQSPGVKYRTIVADPPWPQPDSGARTQSTAGNWRGKWLGYVSEIPYETMSLDDICALPVANLAEPDAHLYLWTTNRFLDESFSVVKAWGFRFSTQVSPAPRIELFARRQRLGWDTWGNEALNHVELSA